MDHPCGCRSGHAMRRRTLIRKSDGTEPVNGTQSASSSAVTTVGTDVVWELRSARTAAIVHCLIEQYEGGHCRIRIMHADGEVMNAWYSSREDAITRAAAVQTDLLQTGWSPIPTAPVS
jgi:hypothetical protein